MNKMSFKISVRSEIRKSSLMLARTISENVDISVGGVKKNLVSNIRQIWYSCMFSVKQIKLLDKLQIQLSSKNKGISLSKETKFKQEQ